MSAVVAQLLESPEGTASSDHCHMWKYLHSAWLRSAVYTHSYEPLDGVTTRENFNFGSGYWTRGSWSSIMATVCCLTNWMWREKTTTLFVVTIDWWILEYLRYVACTCCTQLSSSRHGFWNLFWKTSPTLPYRPYHPPTQCYPTPPYPTQPCPPPLPYLPILFLYTPLPRDFLDAKVARERCS